MSSSSERILVLTPFGRDRFLLRDLLQNNRFDVHLLTDFAELCWAIAQNEAAAILIAEEVLGRDQVQFWVRSCKNNRRGPI